MKKFILGFVVVLTLGICLGYLISWMTQQQQPVVEKTPIAVVEELPARSVQLYFTIPEGTHLVAETAEIPGCEDDRECIEGVLQALIGGSQSGLIPVLPKQTEVLNVEIENDLVRVDFSRQVVDYHPGGSLSELLSIYSIANTLSENFPYVRQVQLLVEGEIRQTLKGHARIDQPVYADLKFNLSSMEDAELSEESGLSIESLIEQAVPDDEEQGLH